MTPNLMKVMANAPASLRSYLETNQTLSGGLLDAQLRERISLRVAELNRCQYCLSAHTLLGSKAGLAEDEVVASREGRSADNKASAVLGLVTAVVEKKGRISASELAAAREGGLSDGEIVEVVSNAALNILTNYINNVAGTEIDFPKVELFAAATV
jgi:AhpD family alkylhydroperoxidase